MRVCRAQPGYLLIELIAAVTLAAIAVAALLPAMSGRSDEVRCAELIERITDFDRRARLLSLREGPVRMVLEPDGALIASQVRGGDRILSLSLEGFEAYIIDTETDAEVRSVTLDRLGRSAGYTVLVRTPDATYSIGVDGMTGRVSVSREEVAP